MPYKITLIPGDGIGPEVARAARQCLEATGIKFEWEEVIAGSLAIKKFGTPLPEYVLKSVRKNRIALKGPIITPIGTGFRSVNVALRQELNLFACLRPAKSIPGVKSPYSNIDLVIVRENTEDLYAGIEFEEGKKETVQLINILQKLQPKKILKCSAISIKPISVTATMRVVRFAFEYALKNKRKKVTAVHKANIMKFSDGLFLSIARKIAKEYAGKIEFNDCLVDNLSMQLVKNPQDFDLLVLPNLYGDIISDLCAGLIGGLGIAPGANIGKGIACFEAVHGSAPKYAGLNKVNPTAMILSGVLMLRYLGEEKAAARLEAATRQVIAQGKFVTYDLKERRDDPAAVGTREMAEAICKRLR
ncbi:MAG: isocitrate dehydrogenase [Omnitrophica WOR_2 bacterium GWB2_45_9]|nr:MAG: isocitrate dehydrogenase [Omnitrophica WOR_2 bacterium GWB2_45_9]OGX53960.1 MAG: isocitrate dehydrogenase [Omnitrophica WOR_2 bacterium RIFOXYB2_FULL_45_11]